ncbi:uncharacterized protein WM277_018918 [Molossus nigricans]
MSALVSPRNVEKWSSTPRATSSWDKTHLRVTGAPKVPAKETPKLRLSHPPLAGHGVRQHVAVLPTHDLTSSVPRRAPWTMPRIRGTDVLTALGRRKQLQCVLGIKVSWRKVTVEL